MWQLTKTLFKNIETGIFAGFITTLLIAFSETLRVIGQSPSDFTTIFFTFLLSAFTILIPLLVGGGLIGFAAYIALGDKQLPAIKEQFFKKPNSAFNVLVWGVPAFLLFLGITILHEEFTYSMITMRGVKRINAKTLNLVEYSVLFVLPLLLVALKGAFVRPVKILEQFLSKSFLSASRIYLYASGVAASFAALFVFLAVRMITPFEDIERLTISSMLIMAVLLLLVFVILLYRQSKSHSRLHNILVRQFAYVPIILIIVLAPTIGQNAQAVAGLNNSGPIFRMISPYYVKLGDFDKDNFSSFMGGGDKSPFDPWVYPAAPEIPGNGIDDNCILGDAPANYKPKLDPAFVELPSNWKDKDFNILFLTIDAVRADHLSYNGYHRKTSPYLDSLAAKSTNFRNAYAQGTGTILSIPSFMTGKYISQLQCKRLHLEPMGRRPAPDTYTLAEYLREKGFYTAVVGSQAYIEFFSEQNWDMYSNPKNKQVSKRGSSSKELTERTIKIINKILPKYKTFMWIHYYDPHDAYLAHKEKSFGHSKIDLYDGEIYYTDIYIKKLIEHWNRVSPLPTIIIISADHGEGLGEHGIPYHNLNFYNSITNVPLLIYLPGEKAQTVTEPVALIDIFPTIRNILGDEPDKEQFGRSLLGEILYNKRNPERVVFQEAQFVQFKKFWSKRGIVTDRYRFIWDMVLGAEELYDLKEDPKELTNLLAKRPDVAEDLREKLYQRMEDVGTLTPQLNYCNYRRPVGRTRFYPPAKEELYSKYILDTLPISGGVDTDIAFGKAENIRLIRYDFSQTKVGKNRKVKVKLYFKSEKRIESDYMIFVHFWGQSKKWKKYKSGYDHWPVKNLLPIYEWPLGKIVVDEFEFNVPRGMGDGDIGFHFGLYSPRKKDRLKVKIRQGKFKVKDNRILLQNIFVMPDIIEARRISDIVKKDMD